MEGWRRKFFCDELSVGDRLFLSETIYTGRDAVLPKLVALIENNKLEETGIDLKGAVIFHTAVSPAGVGLVLQSGGGCPAL